MKNVLELKQQRKALRDQAVEILDKTERGGEDWERYNKIDADIDNLTREIEAIEKLTAAQRAGGEIDAQPAAPKGEEKSRQITTASEEYREAYNNYLRFGFQGLNDRERGIVDIGRSTETRAQSAFTGAAGGYTVPQGFFNELERAMVAMGGMREAARTISTTAGNDLPMPSLNDSNQMGELVAESAAVTGQDLSFGQIIMKAYKYSSKTILIPIELLQDSAINVEAEVRNALADRIFKITNLHFTTGDNAGKPQGAVTGATLGKTGANGQTTSVTYDDLIDLEFAVPKPYRQSARYMMNDSTVKALKKLKDSQGRPLWVPGVAVKEPDTINGYAYTVNNDVAAMGANAKSILFGDLSKYIIRNVMDVTLFRISEKYIENGQVGFLAFYRSDGRLRDAGTHPIAYYANSAT
jgi:HK97 family phage major capsid protein